MEVDKNLISISVNPENGEYKINIAEGSNVAETQETTGSPDLYPPEKPISSETGSLTFSILK